MKRAPLDIHPKIKAAAVIGALVLIAQFVLQETHAVQHLPTYVYGAIAYALTIASGYTKTG